jgi:hypothetical protein
MRYTSNPGRWFFTLVTIAVIFLPAVSGAWGGRSHRWVNRQAFGHLPEEMAGFRRWAGVVVACASEADRRKASDPLESPRHWIDVDVYPEFHQGHLARDLEFLKAAHGHHLDVYGNGVVPWTVAGVTETLSVAMAAGDWSEAVLRAADLGHYVADCHQPLHVTENYDGQLTGNDGVHLRYEIHMVDRNLSKLHPENATAVYVTDPLEHIFETIPGTWAYVDSVMIADREAKKRSPGYGEKYYRHMWTRTGHYTVTQLAQAARILADLWYTAWVDAGRPEFPDAAEIEAIAGLQPQPNITELVTVRGVVTIGSGILDERMTRAYVQDGSGRGILLFDYAPREDISRGDLIEAEGMLIDYEGVTEILGPSVTVLERGQAEPGAPTVQTAQTGDPAWDNTMVGVRGTVAFILEDRDWTRLHVDDGSGAAVVLIRRETGIDVSQVREGDMLAVRGVAAYLDGEGGRAIMPGYADQLTIGGVQESTILDP